jgi:2',3'-cyclic-nucleotide 2'-phosphodiesterase (5'-nucleotidase family)
MKKKLLPKALVTFTLSALFALALKAQINPQLIGRYTTGVYDNASSEISAYDPTSKRMFVTSAYDTSLAVVDISQPGSPKLLQKISLKPYGIDITSVACKNGIVVTAIIDSLGKTEKGKAVFFNASTLAYISQVDVGANPDMITFSPDGKRVLVANEGEPNVGYTIDPEGSVSIIDISSGVSGLNASNVKTAGFTSFNGTSIDKKIKITGRVQSAGSFLRLSTVAEDLEPEYIAISADSKTAWATCQENNCIAEIDIATATVTRLIPLGYKNHKLTGNALDASDNGATINIANYPVFGMYEPDAISAYKFGDTTYLLTANEGDVRADWGTANSEEVRFGSSSYVVDTAKFGGASVVSAMKANTAMGRLTVSNKYGDFNNDGKFDSVFCFGARSFTVWNATSRKLTWDSGEEFEQRLSKLYPNNFNASHTNNTLDNRSDDKGPEPEAITIGKILDSTYAFVGLERIGGIMIYNITNPRQPYFVNYINTRNFTITPSVANVNTVGDLGPEGLVFVPGAESPNGKDLLLVSNEISGTVAIIQLNSRSHFQMQILHSSDMESSVPAVIDAPNYAAIMDKLEDTHVNTLKLSSGDNTLPGPFLSAGEDPALQTVLRSTTSSYYSGTQAVRPAIGRADIAIMNILGFNASALGNHEFDLGTSDLNGQIGVDIRSNGADKRWLGAQFPYVSCNLDFSKDANLSYLYTSQILRDTAFRTLPGITSNNQKKGIAPSIIIERNGQKIGFVGATTQVLAKISSPGFTSIKGPQVDDMPALAAIIQPVVDSLIAKEGVNKIILLAHLQQIVNEKALAPLLKNVDIIISGGNHAFTADGNDRMTTGHKPTEKYPIHTKSATGEPMVILNNTSEWKYVGRFVCDFDQKGILLPQLLDSTVNGVYVSDTAMVTSLWGSYNAAFAAGTRGALVRQICNVVNSIIVSKDGNIIGKSKVFLEGRRNQVRTEESNLGNLSSDANLWYAKKYDAQVKVSIKNGGGIRSAIGYVNSVGSNAILEPTQANASAGKQKGDISQLDVENSLRFNNRLVIVSANAAGLRRLIEHGVAATRPGVTPGQFPQVGGVAFSYDSTKKIGKKLLSLVIIDTLGNTKDTILRNGLYVGDTSRIYKIVTLNFLANPSGAGSPFGGDGYPFPSNIKSRVDLDTAFKTPGTSIFSVPGSEQDAFAEYMLAKHNTSAASYNVRDTTILGDKRIQLLNARPDYIFPETNKLLTIAEARATAAAGFVRTRGIITRAWGRFIYIQDSTGAIAVRQSTGAMVDSISAGKLNVGDSVEILGPRNNFNNYVQIQFTNGAYNSLNRVIKVASKRKLPPVQNLTIKQLLANPENYESELVKIQNLKITGTGNFTASTNYNVWDGNLKGDTTVLRVISGPDTEIDDGQGLTIPAGLFTFEGILIQFCSSPSSGCTSGYQLQGTLKSDIRPQVGPFNLLAPVTNTRVVVKDNDVTPVEITWEPSVNAVQYKWLAHIPGGNFNAPQVVIPSDNAGTATKLTLTFGDISSLIGKFGVNRGDSIQLNWIVRAVSANKNDSINATNSFTIKLVRAHIAGSSPSIPTQSYQIYPNPVQDHLNLGNFTGSAANYVIYDVNGRIMTNGVCEKEVSIDVSSFAPGVYSVKWHTGEKHSFHKFIKL